MHYVLSQADLGEYIRAEETLLWLFTNKSLKEFLNDILSILYSFELDVVLWMFPLHCSQIIRGPQNSKKGTRRGPWRRKKSTQIRFLSDPGIPGVRSMGPSVSDSVQELWLDLTDVTLADEDTNSILTENAKRAI